MQRPREAIPILDPARCDLSPPQGDSLFEDRSRCCVVAAELQHLADGLEHVALQAWVVAEVFRRARACRAQHLEDRHVASSGIGVRTSHRFHEEVEQALRAVLLLLGECLLLAGTVALGNGQLLIALGLSRAQHGLATTGDCERLFALGTNRKARDRKRGPDEGQEYRGCSSRGDPVSTGQSGYAVNESRRRSGDGIANEISAEVSRKLGGA